MAVTWNWSDRIGEMKTKQGARLSLYGGGNVDAAVLAEYRYNKNAEGYSEETKNQYYFWSFWQDTKHLKRCLNDNCYDEITSIKLNTWYDKYSHIMQAAKLWADAGIKVELYCKKPKKQKNGGK